MEYCYDFLPSQMKMFIPIPIEEVITHSLILKKSLTDFIDTKVAKKIFLKILLFTGELED